MWLLKIKTALFNVELIRLDNQLVYSTTELKLKMYTIDRIKLSKALNAEN